MRRKKRAMKKVIVLCLMLSPVQCFAEQTLQCFGHGGQVKMLYDSRQRPQAVYLNDKLHIFFNGGGVPGDKPKAKTRSMAVTYDPFSRTFSKIVTLGKASGDHHNGPVVWADQEEKLHVFCGWHHDLGTHLISSAPGCIGSSLDDWSPGPAPAPKMSYPWMSRIYDDKQLVFYRTDGHYSSWTYRITSDNGKTWQGPENDVTDLDLRGGLDTDWSIYTAKAVSRDGQTLHIGFIAYDDYKRPRSPKEIASGKLDQTRLHNPLYDNRKTSNYKYNLYYVKVDLRTHRVMNDRGEVLGTPIDLSTANSKCMIWDTTWRGSGIVPSMLVDRNDRVSFLHNLSDIQHEESLGYHYVRFDNGVWKHTRITDSNHHWNSGHLARGRDGTLHAYVITGQGYFDSDGYMDRYGGGSVEEWTSADQGHTWKRRRDLTPDRTAYPGWKYNNIQPVKRPDNTVVEGMLLFYGWKDKNAPEARAFLVQE